MVIWGAKILKLLHITNTFDIKCSFSQQFILQTYVFAGVLVVTQISVFSRSTSPLSSNFDLFNGPLWCKNCTLNIILSHQLFGSSSNYFYLCTVRIPVLAIRAESRGGKPFLQALGARHHDNYSAFKTIPYGVVFIVHRLF